MAHNYNIKKKVIKIQTRIILPLWRTHQIPTCRPTGESFTASAPHICTALPLLSPCSLQPSPPQSSTAKPQELTKRLQDFKHQLTWVCLFGGHPVRHLLVVNATILVSRSQSELLMNPIEVFTCYGNNKKLFSSLTQGWHDTLPCSCTVKRRPKSLVQWKPASQRDSWSTREPLHFTSVQKGVSWGCTTGWTYMWKVDSISIVLPFSFRIGNSMISWIGQKEKQLFI